MLVTNRRATPSRKAMAAASIASTFCPSAHLAGPPRDPCADVANGGILGLTVACSNRCATAISRSKDSVLELRQGQASATCPRQQDTAHKCRSCASSSSADSTRAPGSVSASSGRCGRTDSWHRASCAARSRSRPRNPRSTCNRLADASPLPPTPSSLLSPNTCGRPPS